MVRFAKLVLGAFVVLGVVPCFASERAPAAPMCTPRWRPDVFAALDRCIDGDGEGCAGVGRDYEVACDAYASLKWYERGCALGSVGACGALMRLATR